MIGRAGVGWVCLKAEKLRFRKEKAETCTLRWALICEKGRLGTFVASCNIGDDCGIKGCVYGRFCSSRLYPGQLSKSVTFLDGSRKKSRLNSLCRIEIWK